MKRFQNAFYDMHKCVLRAFFEAQMNFFVLICSQSLCFLEFWIETWFARFVDHRLKHLIRFLTERQSRARTISKPCSASIWRSFTCKTHIRRTTVPEGWNAIWKKCITCSRICGFGFISSFLDLFSSSFFIVVALIHFSFASVCLLLHFGFCIIRWAMIAIYITLHIFFVQQQSLSIAGWI